MIIKKLKRLMLGKISFVFYAQVVHMIIMVQLYLENTMAIRTEKG